jgi:hypothetical protein
MMATNEQVTYLVDRIEYLMGINQQIRETEFSNGLPPHMEREREEARSAIGEVIRRIVEDVIVETVTAASVAINVTSSGDEGSSTTKV